MTTSRLNKAIQHAYHAALQDEAGPTNAQLLERFIERRDETAFAALVHRHARLVWGVCRRLLSHHHDAEDAFQATFLVLARKATTVRPRQMVANWLYGVAYRTALKARAASGKRRLRERQVINMPEPQTVPQDPWANLEPVLDQELARLPDKYRAAVILCDLQGKARKEAARQLKIPEGTLSSRLTTARTMLAKRLAHCGLTLSGGLVASVLSQNAASAGAPPSVVSSTIHAATALAPGQTAAGVISLEVAGLTEGVLRAMLLTKLKTVATIVVVLGLLALGGSSFLDRLTAQQGQDESRPGESERAESLQAVKRQEVTFNPRSIDFGVVERGQTPTRTLDVEYTGELSWRITEIVKSLGAPFSVTGEERYRDEKGKPRRVGYRLTFRLKSDSPPGSFNQELLLKTNDPRNPHHTLTAEGNIQDNDGTPATTVKVSDVTYSLPFAFPSAEDILRALPKTELRPKNPRIQGELVAYTVDEARFFPLVGRARLSHAHFRCTVITDEGKAILVYVDRDQLIPAQ